MPTLEEIRIKKEQVAKELKEFNDLKKAYVKQNAKFKDGDIVEYIERHASGWKVGKINSAALDDASEVIVYTLQQLRKDMQPYINRNRDKAMENQIRTLE